MGPAPTSELRLSLEAEEFLSWLAVERGRATNTLAAYRRDLLGLRAVPRRAGASSWPGWARPTCRTTSAELRAGGRAPATVARALVALRSLHRFLLDEGHVASDPTGDVGAPKVPQGLPKALNEDEVARLLGAVVGDDAPARRDRAILELLYGTGMRISELVGLSLGDVGLDEGALRVFGKGSKERVVPLGRYARDALDEWLGGDRSRRHGSGPVGPAGRFRGGVPQHPRGPAVPAGGLGHRAPLRRQGRAWGTASPPTCCATAAPPTCSTTAPTSASSRSCSDTRPSPPPSSTPRCRPSGCAPPTTPPIPEPGAGAAFPTSRR